MNDRFASDALIDFVALVGEGLMRPDAEAFAAYFDARVIIDDIEERILAGNRELRSIFRRGGRHGDERSIHQRVSQRTKSCEASHAGVCRS